MYIRRGKLRPAKTVLTSELNHLASGATSIPSQPVKNEHADLYCDLELTIGSVGSGFAPLTGIAQIEFVDAETGKRIDQMEFQIQDGMRVYIPEVALPRGRFKVRVWYAGSQPLNEGNELKIHPYPLEVG